MKTKIRQWLLLLVTVIALAVGSALPAFAAARPVLLAKGTATGATTAKITWEKLSGASRYVVYYTKCGTTLSTHSKSVTASGRKSSCKLKNLDSNDSYKFKVYAQKKVSGKYKTFAISLKGHVVMNKDGKNTNPKGVCLSSPSMSIGVGSTVELAAQVNKKSSGKALLTHEAPIRYVSSNPAIASVSTDGLVKARKKGSCRIYAIAVNGAWAATEVKVTPAASKTKTKTIKKTVTKKADTYKVTYQYVGTVPKGAPALPKAITCKVGKSVPKAAVPSLKGYKFSGWNGEVSKMPEKNVLVTGSWSGNEHKITYKYTGTVPKNAPAVPAASTRKYGDAVPAAYKPSLAGYTFSGWQGEVSKMPDKDVTVTGSWSKKKYKVTYQFAGDVPEKAKAPSAVEYAYGDPVKDPFAGSYEGYEFKGWNGTVKTMPDHNVTVVGIWQRKEYTLSYAYEEYTGRKKIPAGFSFPKPPRSVKVRYGDELPLVDVPVSKGFRFDEDWTLDGEPVPKTMPAKDLTVSGSWHGEYTVTYQVFSSKNRDEYYSEHSYNFEDFFSYPLGKIERSFLEDEEVLYTDFLLFDAEETDHINDPELDPFDAFNEACMHQGYRFFNGGFDGTDYSTFNELMPNWCGEAFNAFESESFYSGPFGWFIVNGEPPLSEDGSKYIIDNDYTLYGCLCTPMPTPK